MAFSEQWLEKAAKNNPHIKINDGTVSASKAMTEKPALRHKFNAQKDLNDGIKFDSKLEGSYYRYLKWRIQQGEVLFFHRQVPFDLPGNTKYRCDFQIFESSGSVHYVDVKGVETKGFIKVKKQVEALFPVEIEVVKKGDFPQC